MTKLNGFELHRLRVMIHAKAAFVAQRAGIDVARYLQIETGEGEAPSFAELSGIFWILKDERRKQVNAVGY